MDIRLKALAKEISVALVFVSLCLLIFLRVGLRDLLLDISILGLAFAFLFEAVRGKRYLYIILFPFWMILLPTYGVDYFNQKYQFDESASLIQFPGGGVVHDDGRFVYFDSTGRCYSGFQISDYQCKRIIRKFLVIR